MTGLTPERRAMLRDDSVEAVDAGLNWIALPPGDLLALLDAADERDRLEQVLDPTTTDRIYEIKDH